MPITLPRPPELRAAEVALFLDVDGTLLEIAHEPGAVNWPRRACGASSSNCSRRPEARARPGDGPFAFDQLDRLFAPLRFSAAGLHGLERRNLGF